MNGQVAAPHGIHGAATVDAVNTALQRELATAGTDPAFAEFILDAADVLLHRAVLEDRRPLRRAAKLAELQATLRRQSADPFAAVEQTPSAVVEVGVARDVVTLLAGTDLPELGRAAPPEHEEAAVAAMDWLGREVDSEITPSQVTAYLSRRGEVGTRVTSVRRLAGGFSKMTLLLQVERDGRTVELVIRQVQPGRDAGGLAAEFDVLQTAWKQGVPAPEPLWLEPEPNSLGGPFFVTRRVAGSNRGDVFGPRPGTEPAVALELAAALATLHAIPQTELPAPPVPPMSGRSEILARVSEQHDRLETAAGLLPPAPRPLDALLFEWLRQHAPDDAVRPVLLHGDPGFHNLLVDGGTVTALLDWERALVGDPAQDLAYVRSHVEQVAPWADFVDAYCAAGGAEPSPERLRFYTVWQDAWRYVGSLRGLARLHGDRASVLDAVTGLLHAPRFLLGALRTAFEVDL